MSQATAQPHNGHAAGPSDPPTAPESRASESAKPRHHQAAVCSSCGYSLAGLNPAVCPECGATPTAAPSLTSRTASGFAWAVGQSLAAKIVSIGGQLVLARILLKEDFGLVAMATGIASLVSVLQYAGLQEILVQRQKHFDRWAPAAFWLSACIGLASAAFVAGAGPVTAMMMHDGRMIPIMAIAAATTLLSALQIVPMAMLQISLRLRLVSAIMLLGGAGSVALTVPLALAGFGAYSLMLGPFLIQPIVLGILWKLSRPRIGRRLRARRWKYMFGDSALLLGVGLINNFTSQGANLILGALHAASVVGVFSFGYNLSLQSIILLTQNLAVVFFPALSKLQEHPERMLAAFVRASRMLSVIGMPACAMQAALARPFMHLLFGTKWDEAIPVMQWLSVGLAFGILGSLMASLIKAAGRFRFLFWLTVGYTAVYLAFTTAAALLGGASEMAVAVSAYFVIVGPVCTFLVVREFGGGWREVWEIFGLPLFCAGVSVGGGWWLGQWAISLSGTPWLAFVVVPAISVLLYAPLVCWLMPETSRELIARVVEFSRRG